VLLCFTDSLLFGYFRKLEHIVLVHYRDINEVSWLYRYIFLSSSLHTLYVAVIFYHNRVLPIL
jgi:hypothetical protein